MNSDMSMRTIARSSSNRNSASARASSVLPTPVGPMKMKLPMGRFGSCKPGARAPDRVGDRGDRLVLADHALLEALLHRDQLLDLALHHARDGHAGPLADDLGDVFLVHLFLEHLLVLLELGEAARPVPRARCCRSGIVPCLSSAALPRSPERSAASPPESPARSRP